MTEPLSPKRTGFRMPAEWEEQEAVWLSWPTSADNWPDCLGEVEKSYFYIIEALHLNEKVHILADSDEHRGEVSAKIATAGISPDNIFIHTIKTGDVWIRDYGPTFLIDNGGRTLGIDWIFNAWGGKYEELLDDSGVPEKIAPIAGCGLFSPGAVMEGGAFDTNGADLCITTRQCLLNPNRNPGLGQEQIERLLIDSLGTEKVIWLEGGIAGDDTDGHVDDLARFVDADTVMLAREEDAADENAAVLEQNARCIRDFCADTGRAVETVRMPMPSPLIHEGRRFPASYMNFLLANGVVLLPVFGDRRDSYAEGLLRERFPKHTVVPVDCRHLVRGFGAIHCASQQQPRAATATNKNTGGLR